MHLYGGPTMQGRIQDSNLGIVFASTPIYSILSKRDGEKERINIQKLSSELRNNATDSFDSIALIYENYVIAQRSRISTTMYLVLCRHISRFQSPPFRLTKMME